MRGYLRRARRRVLRAFGRFQRPAAWAMLVGYGISLVAVLADWLTTGDTKVVTVLVAVGLINDGIQAVREVENELDSEGSAEA